MNLDAFGFAPAKPSNGRATKGPEFEPKLKRRGPIQWAISNREFVPCGATHPQLPAGAYSFREKGLSRSPVFVPQAIHADDLIDFIDNLPSQIVDETERFWSLGERFRRHGVLHRRGYLFYGPQGTGKWMIQ